MPTRHEPVTQVILDVMWELCADKNEDSLESALHNWNILGNFYGFRISEWAQNEENKYDFPLLAIDDTLLAFTFEDFKFAGKGRRRMRKNFTTTLRNGNVKTNEVRRNYQKKTRQQPKD